MGHVAAGGIACGKLGGEIGVVAEVSAGGDVCVELLGLT